MLMGGGDPFHFIGEFPPGMVGIPYDAQIALAGSHIPPSTIDVFAGTVPAGLTLEISVDGEHARLHGTPLPDITITGLLGGFLAGVAYSCRLQVNNLAPATAVADISAGSMPAWMSIAWHSDSSEIEFYGTPP